MPARLGSIGAAIAVVVLVAAILAGARSRSDERPEEPSEAVVRLPRMWPQHLAVTDDGSLWITDAYHGIARLGPRGRVREYVLDPDELGLGIAVDVIQGPDGAIWFAGVDTVGRIDSAGRIRTWRVASARAIAAGREALWFANEGDPGSIARLSTNGAIAGLRLSGVRASFTMNGIAVGPGGALWFTQAGDGRDPADGIGRMTPGGRYTSWPLSRRRATPARITAGPDGALWFTEQEAHAIGRITADGEITEFALRTGLNPYDITSGSDGALWFTADSCIGRITTGGRMTAWRVRGARRLVGIAAARGGGFWLADAGASAVRRFIPPSEGSARSAGCPPPTVARAAGRTRATLVYRRLGTFDGDDEFADGRVSIWRDGRKLFAEVIPPHPQGLPSYHVFGSAGSFEVRDLDGDGEPEVLVELHWGGTHCCVWSRVYRYDASRTRYVPANRFWGNTSSAPRLKDLDGDGRPEFVSTDDRFAYSFDGYAGSVRPIQIWSYRRGVVRDVTRRYPAQIMRDAAEIWRLYLRYRGRESVQGIVPAWAADQYLLGRGQVVERVLASAGRRGFLDCRSELSCFGQPRTAQGYVQALRRLLRRTGYIRG